MMNAKQLRRSKCICGNFDVYDKRVNDFYDSIENVAVPVCVYGQLELIAREIACVACSDRFMRSGFDL